VVAPGALQLYLRHLTGATLGVLILVARKVRVKISARRKKFMLLCRTVGFEISFNNYNRAEHKGRIPQ